MHEGGLRAPTALKTQRLASCATETQFHKKVGNVFGSRLQIQFIKIPIKGSWKGIWLGILVSYIHASRGLAPLRPGTFSQKCDFGIPPPRPREKKDERGRQGRTRRQNSTAPEAGTPGGGGRGGFGGQGKRHQSTPPPSPRLPSRKEIRHGTGRRWRLTRSGSFTVLLFRSPGECTNIRQIRGLGVSPCFCSGAQGNVRPKYVRDIPCTIRYLANPVNSGYS